VKQQEENFEQASSAQDITPYSPLKVNRRFGGTYRLHLQGRRISPTRNQRESKWQAEPSFEVGGDMFLENVG
jgi:hypothetical protein